MAGKSKTEQMMDDAAARGAENAIAMMRAEKSPESLDLSEQVNQEAEDEIMQGIQSDIFMDVGEARTKQGDSVIYQIRKDGNLLCNKRHPYSWDDLQKEFGGGVYHVVARSVVTKKILKHQTQSVSDPVQEEAEESFSFNDQPTPTPKEAAQDPLKMLMLFQQMQAQSTERMMAMLTPIITAIAPSLLQRPETKSVDQGMLEFMSKSADVQNRMIERLNDKFEAMMTQGLHKSADNSADPMRMLELVRAAEDRGFDKWQALDKLANERAMEREELMGAGSGSSGDRPSKPKSMLESIMETTLPVIAQAIAVGSQPQQPVQAPAQDRRSLPAPGDNDQPRPRNRGTEEHKRPQTTQKTNQDAQGTAARPSQAHARKVMPDTNVLGLSVARPKPKLKEAPMIVMEPVEQKTQEPETKEIPVEVNKKALLRSLLLPVIGQCLKARQAADFAVTECIPVLREHSLTPRDVIENYSVDDFYAIADEIGIPLIFKGAVKKWLGEFHAAMQKVVG